MSSCIPLVTDTMMTGWEPVYAQSLGLLLLDVLLFSHRSCLFLKAVWYYFGLLKRSLTFPKSGWITDKRGIRWETKLHWRSSFRTSKIKIFSKQPVGLLGYPAEISWQSGAEHVGTLWTSKTGSLELWCTHTHTHTNTHVCINAHAHTHTHIHWERCVICTMNVMIVWC